MSRFLSLRIAGLLLLAVASTATAAELNLPEFEIAELANGMKFCVAEDHSIPIVTLNVVIPHGNENDPPGKKGLASITAQSCCNGIPGMDGTQIWQELQRLGGSVSGWATYDHTFFSMTCLSSNWKAVLDMLAKGIRTPTFPKKDFARTRSQWISGQKEQMEQPSSLAYTHGFDLLYEGPLGETVTIEGLRSLSRDDLVNFHRKYYMPNRALLVTIGDFDSDEAIEVLKNAFEDWPTAQEPPQAPVSHLRTDGPRVRLVHKPDLTQATIGCGQPGLSSIDPGRFAFGIANTGLGGYFCSRLMAALRIQGGKTYGAGSFNRPQLRQGQFGIGTFTRNAELGAAIDTIQSVVKEFVRAGMTQDEFETARNDLLGTYVINLETPQQLTRGVTGALATGFSLDDYRSEPSRYEAVALEEANRAAADRISPDEMVWVIVADKNKIGSALDALGDYQTVFYKEPMRPGNFITRTRLGVGATWNTVGRGARVSLLHRWVALSGTYGFERRNKTWDYDKVGQVTLDLHRRNSEYSSVSLYLGATADLAENLNGWSPHLGFRVFPYGLGGHFSFSTELGGTFWHKGDLPRFYWSAGLDRFF
jgi:zinc protease